MENMHVGLYDRVVEILDDYGILYGDIVDNGDGTINIVGVDESEWADVVDAIENELGLEVEVPDYDHEEFDDELVVIGESLEEQEAPKYADDLEIEIANKLEKAFPREKGVQENSTDIVMDIVDYFETYYDEGKTQDEIRAKLIERLPDYEVTHMGIIGRIIDLVIKEFGIDKWDWSEGHPTESLEEDLLEGLKANDFYNQLIDVIEEYIENLENEDGDTFAGTEDSYANEMLSQHVWELVDQLDTTDEKKDTIFSKIINNAVKDPKGFSGYLTIRFGAKNESLKESKDNFKDLTIEEMFFEVAGKKFKVFDKNGHFTKEAWKLYDKVAERFGDYDKFDALCGEEGCFEDDEDIQYSANESLKESKEDTLIYEVDSNFVKRCQGINDAEHNETMSEMIGTYKDGCYVYFDAFDDKDGGYCQYVLYDKDGRELGFTDPLNEDEVVDEFELDDNHKLIVKVKENESLKEGFKPIKLKTKEGKEIFIVDDYGSGYQVATYDGFGNFNPWQKMETENKTIDGEEYSFVVGYDTYNFDTVEEAIKFAEEQYGELEKVNEALTEKKDDGTCPYCHSENIDIVDSDDDSTKYVCRDCGEDFLVHIDGEVTTRNNAPIKEEVGEAFQRTEKEDDNHLFRVVIVEWRDARNSDTFYEDSMDFTNKEEAVKWAEENRETIRKEYEENGLLDDLVALDLDVEEWVGDDVIGVVDSITVWEKEPMEESRGRGFVTKYKGHSIIDAGDRFVITNEHGLNVGETKFGLPIAKGMIDDLVAGKKIKEDIDREVEDKLQALYNDGDVYFDTANDNGETFLIVDGWEDVRKIQKSLRPDFEPKDEYDTSVLDEIFGYQGDGWGFRDSYSKCDNCGKVIRTEADSYSWVPDFFVDYDNGEIICGDCVRENPQEYLETLYNNPEKANTILSAQDLIDNGFEKIEGDYESGWYDRNDSPEEILDKALAEHPSAAFIFNISSQGQFATQFELWGADLDLDEKLIKEGVSVDNPSLKRGIAYLNRFHDAYGYICSYLDPRTHQQVLVNRGFKTEKELRDFVTELETKRKASDVSVIRQGEQQKYLDAIRINNGEDPNKILSLDDSLNKEVEESYKENDLIEFPEESILSTMTFGDLVDMKIEQIYIGALDDIDDLEREYGKDTPELREVILDIARQEAIDDIKFYNGHKAKKEAVR